jgi:hypothetical protein
MTLKTATLLATIGTGIKVVWSLAMAVKSLQIASGPAVYRLATIPALLFEIGLFLFFLSLLKEQKTSGGEE